MSGWPCLKASTPCVCHCHKIQAARKNRPPRPGRAWTREQDDALRARLKTGMHASEITAYLNRRFKTDRTLRAVHVRIGDLGMVSREWFSRQDVARRLAVDPRTVERWIVSGTLPAQRYRNLAGQISHWWSILPEDFYAFVDRHAGDLFKPEAVIDPAIRARAEVAARVNARKSA